MIMRGLFSILTLTVVFCLPAPATAAEPGFVLVAPDRGFVGNEETRAAFAPFDRAHAAELVFITDERGAPLFEAAARRLAEAGHEPVVVLPLLLSEADGRMRQLQDYRAAADTETRLARPFGQRVHAPAVLADRLAALPDGNGDVVIAMDTGGKRADEADLQRDLDRLIANLDDHWPDRTLRGMLIPDDYDAMGDALASLDPGTHVIPFHLGRKLDGMMATTAYLKRQAPEGVTVHTSEVTPHQAVTQWLFAEAGRHLEGPVGVIVHAHGSDFHWNESMREAAGELAGDYAVEYAFSMADPDTIDNAVRRLEERGIRQAVLVRVFGMAHSFRDGLESLLGLDYERHWSDAAVHEPETAGHGYGMTGSRRLASRLALTTVGGLEDHRLFARALLDRARALSETPTEETVVLVSHGTGNDERNAHWQDQLASLAEQMRANGGDAFHRIEWATWREDWPDKRDDGIEKVRRLIHETEADGGRTLLIPARTISQGPARELLPDEDFALGEGFAPHPQFTEWLREQTHKGLDLIRQTR